MTETLHVRWKPGTLDTLLVTTAAGLQEWPKREFERLHGRAVLAALYLRGSAIITREIPIPVQNVTGSAA